MSAIFFQKSHGLLYIYFGILLATGINVFRNFKSRDMWQNRCSVCSGQSVTMICTISFPCLVKCMFYRGNTGSLLKLRVSVKFSQLFCGELIEES